MKSVRIYEKCHNTVDVWQNMTIATSYDKHGKSDMCDKSNKFEKHDKCDTKCEKCDKQDICDKSCKFEKSYKLEKYDNCENLLPVWENMTSIP